MDAEKVCKACGEKVAACEFRRGASVCRACEMIAQMRWAREMAVLDGRRMSAGLRPWGMRLKPAAM